MVSARPPPRLFLTPLRACDPHRLGDPCLVYSVGTTTRERRPGGPRVAAFRFEEAAGRCGVHVFDATSEHEMEAGGASEIRFHPWRIGKEAEELNIAEAARKLGHLGESGPLIVDVLKIKCYGCEFDAFESWFSDDVVARQILLEVHHYDQLEVEKTHALFRNVLERGYVIFHKEPILEHFTDVDERQGGTSEEIVYDEGWQRSEDMFQEERQEKESRIKRSRQEKEPYTKRFEYGFLKLNSTFFQKDSSFSFCKLFNGR